MNRFYLNKNNTKLPPVLPPHYPIDKPLLITTITNDKVILKAYGLSVNSSESEILQKLFAMYEELASKGNK